jgi:kanamycin kinase
VAWQYGPEAITYRMEEASGEVHFLKIAPSRAYPSLAGEADRMRWAQGRLPVPQVLEQGSDGDLDWLLTKGLAGADATAPAWAADSERLVSALASGLRRFHETTVSGCPFDFRLDRALAHARRRVQAGLVVPERDFHEEFSGLSAASALSILEQSRPAGEDVVLCHGDYCPPNVMMVDWAATGFLDLGEMGTADRWWDLAVAAWSITWNLGPGYEDLFLSSYGVERNEERVEFYRLLYDVVS